MANDKKRSSAQNAPLVGYSENMASFASASSLSRQPARYSNYPPYSPGLRSPSPPASAYFSTFPDATSHQEPQPVGPNAGAHFAYSTTLRRHNVDVPLLPSAHNVQSLTSEGANLLDRAVKAVLGGHSSQGNMENGYANGHARAHDEPTPSSVYAHYTVEVSLISI